MGGSAIGAELVAAAAGDRLRVPLIVHRDYGLPAGAGERTLVVAASHSGETVETLSGFAAARERKLPTGRHHHRRARSPRGHEPPGCRCSATGSAGSRAPPSASASASCTSCSRAPASSTSRTTSARRSTRWRSCSSASAPSVETDANPAKQLAWSIFGRIPVIYGHGPMAAVAHRWKTQLNENAKAWAAWEPMPEANHNAIEGSLNPRELATRCTWSSCATRPSRPRSPSATGSSRSCSASGPRTAARSGPRGRHRWPGSSRGVAYGDLVSVYLAILYQTDPTPVTLLAMLKERLARATGSDPTGAR